MTKKKILIFIDWYLPGYKAGGPIKSVFNLCSYLKDELDIYIITSDRDLGDSNPYTKIKPDKWTSLNGEEVMYLSPENRSLSELKRLMTEREYDSIYVNGMFSLKFSIFPLIAAKQMSLSAEVIIAPRGMLGKGALKIKPFKKKIFLSLMKWLGVYKSVSWHATSQHERTEIKDNISKGSTIVVIPNLPSVMDIFRTDKTEQSAKNSIRLVFFSRISEKKNLLFALRVLKEIRTSTNISYDIYGPIDDEVYWKRCIKEMSSLPANISVFYKGELHPSEITDTISKYDALFFPTSHENFGHTIIEALQGGLFVIISDQTPWIDVAKHRVGQSIPLDRPDKFKEAILSVQNLTHTSQIEKNEKYLEEKLNPKDIKEKYLQLFSNP